MPTPKKPVDEKHWTSAHELANQLLKMPDKPLEFLEGFGSPPMALLSVYEHGDVICIDVGE